jgi:monoamine oxidase
MIIKEEDVVIIGAGAAGIGAGLALSRLGVPYLILEAKHRVGGRAHTDVDTFGRPWDRGCHWFYSADLNPLRALADRLEHPYEKENSEWMSAIHLGDRWASDGELVSAREFVADGFARIAAADKDVAIAEIVNQDGEWVRLMRDRIAQFRANEPENISALAYSRYEDSNVSRAVSAGVGALFEHMARGLPVRTGCEVRRIGINGGRVEVEGRDDTMVSAGAAIVTVSTEVLRSGAIEFDPALPDEMTTALDSINLGYAEKIALSLKSDPFGFSETTRITLSGGSGDEARHVQFEIIPNGRPLAVAHIGGDLAHDLAEAGEAAMVDYALSALVSAYGSDVASMVVETAATNWSTDPYVLGGYSAVKPGKVGARSVLREPAAERIYFAGEATSSQYFATCHGAYLSGLDAGHRAAEMLGHWQAEQDPEWLPVFG